MKRRSLKLSEAADDDLFNAWRLVAERDGSERAEIVYSRIMTFVLSLAEFAEIGTRHDDHGRGLRSSGVPGLRTATVLFVVSDDRVTVVRISYLGRDIWNRISSLPIFEVEDIRAIKQAVAEADAGAEMVPHEEVVAESRARIAKRLKSGERSDD